VEMQAATASYPIPAATPNAFRPAHPTGAVMADSLPKHIPSRPVTAPRLDFMPNHVTPAWLDRTADLLLSWGRSQQAERLSERALELREGTAC
jgi:hypothetical protein